MNKTTLGLLALSTVLLFALSASVMTCRKHMLQSKSDAAAVRAANTALKQYKDAAGRTHAEKPLIEGSRETIEALRGELMDSVAKTLKVLNKRIQAINAIGVTTAGTIEPKVYYIDSTKKDLKLEYSDKWLTLEGIVGENTILDYVSFDSIIVATYRKKTGWFKRDTYIDAYSLNPHSVISGITGVRVHEEKSKRWGVGPYIGFGFNGASLQPSVGLGVQYSLIKF